MSNCVGGFVIRRKRATAIPVYTASCRYEQVSRKAAQLRYLSAVSGSFLSVASIELQSGGAVGGGDSSSL
jgi:hypothetical protein